MSAPVYPELPLAARPRWPAWMAPAAFFSAFGVTIAAGFPLLPVALLTEAGDAVAGIALLVLVWSRTPRWWASPCSSPRGG